MTRSENITSLLFGAVVGFIVAVSPPAMPIPGIILEVVVGAAVCNTVIRTLS